jgi:hypothetical protein
LSITRFIRGCPAGVILKSQNEYNAVLTGESLRFG